MTFCNVVKGFQLAALDNSIIGLLYFNDAGENICLSPKIIRKGSIKGRLFNVASGTG